MEVEAWLARAAATQPKRAALETSGGDWSYARLHDAARFAAGELIERGAGRGTRVAIALPAGLEFAQALHACLLLGAVAVPVDLRLAPAERERIAAGADVRVEQPLGEGPVPASLPGVGTHELDATAVVIHTSGTTSTPRPVELTYGNFMWSAFGSAIALGLDRHERWLCALPLSHVGGLSILLRSAIYATSAVVHERFEEDRVLHALQEQRVTLVSLVATTLARLLDAGLEAPPRCARRSSAAARSRRRCCERARTAGVPVSLTYGLTESCSQATTTAVAEIGELADAGALGEDTDEQPNAGPPLFCTRVQIAGDGEILLAGPTVAAAALAADGWLHTGDLGELDERGRLHVTGRKADTIVSGGENVAPVEVEAVLEAHPQVLEAAVLGRSDPQWGEAVTAIVVARAGAAPAPEELRAHCARALAPYKVPKRVVLSAEPLPRTRSGKLLRRELQ